MAKACVYLCHQCITLVASVKSVKNVPNVSAEMTENGFWHAVPFSRTIIPISSYSRSLFCSHFVIYSNSRLIPVGLFSFVHLFHMLLKIYALAIKCTRPFFKHMAVFLLKFHIVRRSAVCFDWSFMQLTSRMLLLHHAQLFSYLSVPSCDWLWLVHTADKTVLSRPRRRCEQTISLTWL